MITPDVNVPVEVLQRLDAIAAKLGVVASHLWVVLIKQAISDGTVYLTFSFIGLLVATGAGFSTKYAFFKYRHSDGYNERDTWFWATIGSAVVLAIAGLLCIWTGSDGFQQFYNPEYYALQSLIKGL